MSRRRSLASIGILVVLAAMGLELGGYAVGRATNRLTAVRIRENRVATQSVPQYSGTLKIITYNICRGRGGDANPWPVKDQPAMEKRLQDIADLLATEAADIVVLNEVDLGSLSTGRLNQARHINRRAGYPFCIEQRNVDAATLLAFRERFGNAVLSRYPVRQARLVSFPGYRKWETILGGKSNAVLCDVILSEKLSIRLLATHLESRSEAVRVESARIIERERLGSPLPFLVVGDLNSTPKGFPYADEANGQNALSLLLAGGGYTTLPLRDPTPADCTIVVGNPIKIVDWVLVPPTWRITSRRVLPLSASDHCAVVVEVSPADAANPHRDGRDPVP
jgi:endonuclease/exonuclease/phosphatase family metal-dependent hydrolase